MLQDITIGQYLPGESFTHKLDPRTKIIISLLFIASLFIINKFVGYIFVVAFLGAVIINSKVPLRLIFKSLKPSKGYIGIKLKKSKGILMGCSLGNMRSVIT